MIWFSRITETMSSSWCGSSTSSCLIRRLTAPARALYDQATTQSGVTPEQPQYVRTGRSVRASTHGLLIILRADSGVMHVALT